MKVKILFYTGLSLVIFLFSALVPPDNKPQLANKFVVVLDAGHGGHDPGNLGNGYLEKNIALGIVLETGKVLEARDDIEVVYTRKDDSFVDLYVRGEIANKAKADLFVSVHCDSHSSDANGAGTFVLGLHANKQNFEIAKKENSVIYLEDNYESRYADYDINSPESIIGLTIMQEEFLEQSILLGKMMQDNFTKRLSRKDRKVKQAGFIVLHQTFMPSVLVETGFLTNKNEGAYLNSGRGQAEMGRAIADAIVQYKTNLRGAAVADTPSNTITSVPEPPEEKKELEEDVAEIAVDEPEEEIPAKTENIDKSIPEADNADIAAKEAAVISETKTAEEPLEKAAVEKEIGSPQPIEQDNSSKEEVKEPVKSLDSSAEPMADKTEKTIVEKPEANPPQPVEVKEPKKETTAKAEKSQVIFKVQILASARQIPLRSENFNGLSKISKEPYKNLYRYMYGETGSYDQAKLLKSNADLKGYTTSFIVAYKEGVRVPVREALKYLSE